MEAAAEMVAAGRAALGTVGEVEAGFLSCTNNCARDAPTGRAVLQLVPPLQFSPLGHVGGKEWLETPLNCESSQSRHHGPDKELPAMC